LKRYIGGGRKRDQATDLRRIGEFVTRNTVSSRMEASRLADRLYNAQAHAS
jgi:hypothetical protein